MVSEALPAAERVGEVNEQELANEIVVADETPTAVGGERKAAKSRDEVPAEAVLLWLGFCLIHVACWGILEICLRSSQYLGLVALFIYTLLLASMAQGVGGLRHFQALRNTLWIVTGAFILITGSVSADVLHDRVDQAYHFGCDYGPGCGSSQTMHVLMLVLAVGPMTLFGLYQMCRRHVPGLFVNVYFGLFYVALLLWDIVTVGNRGHTLPDLLLEREDLLLAYCGITYGLLTLLCIFFDTLPCKLDIVKPWVAGCSILPLWVLMHLVLGITFENNQVSTEGNWGAYSFLVLVQILVALILSERLPMILAGISLLLIAERVSRVVEVQARSWFASSPNVEDMAMAARLTALALTGAAVLLLTILYASRRKDLDRLVRRGRRALKGAGAEDVADAEAVQAAPAPAGPGVDVEMFQATV